MRKILCLFLLLCVISCITINYVYAIYSEQEISRKIIITDAKTKETKEILTYDSNTIKERGIMNNNIEISPYIPENLKNQSVFPRTVIGTDQRTPVSDESKTRYPYTAIGLVTTKYPLVDVEGEGTGALISDNIVLTAGHNIYINSYGGYADRVTFTPGKYSNDGDGYAPYGVCNVAYYVTVEEYMNQSDVTTTREESAQVDWGILILEENVGNSTGTLGMRYYDDLEDMDRLAIMMTGYPMLNGVMQYNQWQMAGNIRDVFERYMSYEIDSTSGQSGAPVYEFDNHIVGVHNTNGIDRNYAARVNEFMINECIEIIENY